MGSRALVAILFVAEILDTWPASSSTDPEAGAEASESGAATGGNCVVVVEFILQLDLIGKKKSFVNSCLGEG